MDRIYYTLTSFVIVLSGLVQGNNLYCQRSAYLKADLGSITEPLYPDSSTDDGVGLRSCWFFNHTLKEDYIVGVELKSINVGATETNSLWFSDQPPIYRKKVSPFCFLYVRANNSCSKERAVSAMYTLMPNCRGKTKTKTIEAERIPAVVILSSNVINAWRVKSMTFHVDYRFLPCGVSNPSVSASPGGGSVNKPGGIPSPSQPCQGNGSFDKFSSNQTTNLLPAVIALAVVLGIETMILFIVIMRYGRLRASSKEDRHITKSLELNGRELDPLEYQQMQVQLRS